MNELSMAKIKCPFDFGEKKGISKYEAAYYEIRYCREDCPFFECYEDGKVHCYKVDIERMDIKAMLEQAERAVQFFQDLKHAYKMQNKKYRRKVNNNE